MADLRTRAAMAANPAAQDPTDPAGLFAAVDERIASAVADGTGIDLSTSGIEASMDVPVNIAWSRVMGEVQWIGKTMPTDGRGNATGLKYAFRGIDAILDAVGPAIRKHGVTVLPYEIETEYDQVPTSGGRAMQRCRVKVWYAITGPRGDEMNRPLVAVGESFDSGDKATPKAMSVALRTAYIQGLNIPTRQPEMDPEHGPQYEVQLPPPPTAADYRGEILNERTSLARLRAIREELDRHPVIGEAIVSDIDETEMPLIKLLGKIGRERKAKEEA